jgi:hypothetical protein
MNIHVTPSHVDIEAEYQWLGQYIPSVGWLHQPVKIQTFSKGHVAKKIFNDGISAPAITIYMKKSGLTNY